MCNFRVYPLFAIVCLLSSVAFGQQQMGWAMDQHAGIGSAFLQPAATADIPYDWDLNLVGASGFLNNNVLFIEQASALGLLRDFAKSETIGLDDTEYAFGLNGNRYDYSFEDHQRPVFVNTGINVLGPSFSIQIGSSTRVGAFSRLRALSSTRRVDFKANYNNYLDQPSGVDLPLTSLYAAAAAWSEVGGNISQAIPMGYDGELRIGINLKHLTAFGGAAIFNPDGSQIRQDSMRSLNISNLETEIGLTGNLLGEGEDLQSAGGGFAADFGFQYAWGSDSDGKYQYVAGVSVSDIGQLNFNRSGQVHRFVNSGDVLFLTADYDTLANAGVDGFLQQLSADVYDGDTGASLDGRGFKVGLPTTISAQFSFRPVQEVQFAAAYRTTLGLRSEQLSQGNQLYLGANYSKWWYGAGLSANVHNWDSFSIGMQLRAGPFYVGSDRLIGTVLKTSKLRGGDFYFGIRLHDFGRKGGKKGGKFKNRKGNGKKVGCYDFS
jgi:hypothetical protein